jgi:hypothetical protein
MFSWSIYPSMLNVLMDTLPWQSRDSTMIDPGHLSIQLRVGGARSLQEMKMLRLTDHATVYTVSLTVTVSKSPLCCFAGQTYHRYGWMGPPVLDEQQSSIMRDAYE